MDGWMCELSWSVSNRLHKQQKYKCTPNARPMHTHSAGRDGLPSQCVLMYAPRDYGRAVQMLRMSGRSKFERGKDRLEAMRGYTQEGSTKCRHAQVRGAARVFCWGWERGGFLDGGGHQIDLALMLGTG